MFFRNDAITFPSRYQALFKSFGAIIRKEMGTNFQPSTSFALEVLKYQAYFHLTKFGKKSKKRPSSMPNKKASAQSGRRNSTLQRFSLPAIHFNIDNPEEKAAIRIQAAFKGFLAKKMRRACFPGIYLFVNLYHNILVFHFLALSTKDSSK